MWLSFKVRNENEMYGYADGFQKYSTQEFTLCFYSTYPIVWYIIFPCLKVKLTIRPDIVVPILRIQLFWLNKPFTFITGVIWNKIENDFYIWGELNKNIWFCINFFFIIGVAIDFEPHTCSSLNINVLGISDHKASLTPPPFIEEHVPSQDSVRSCICVFDVSISPLYSIFLMNFKTISTVWWVFCSFYHAHRLLPR